MFADYVFQRKTIDWISQEILDMLKRKDNIRKTITLQSTTGSGKTVIASKSIEKVHKDNINTCFIWISIADGGLNEQSCSKFNSFTNDTILGREFYLGMNSFNPNEVCFVSLQKSKVGSIIEDREKRNLFEVAQTTKLQGRNIVVILDESHIGGTTDKTQEVIEGLKADVVFYMSATPKNEKHSETVYNVQYSEEEDTIGENGKPKIIRKKIKKVDNYNSVLYKIDRTLIKDAGIITKRIYLNSDLPSKFDLEILLKSVLNKKKELFDLYNTNKSIDRVINPMIIVQFENDDVNDTSLLNEKQIIRDFFEKEGLVVDEWTAKVKPTHSNIEEIDSEVDVLFTKMAIATGWDCPRAKILLGLREFGSKSFGLQTVGRIMRMPEHKHYDIEELDSCYIYTLLTENEPLNEIISDDIRDEVLKNKAVLKEGFEFSSTLYTTIIKSPQTKLIFNNSIFTILRNKYNSIKTQYNSLVYDKEYTKKVVSNFKVEFDDKELGKVDKNSEQMLTNEQKLKVLSNILKQKFSEYENYNTLIDALLQYVDKSLSYRQKLDFLLVNDDFLEEVLNETLKEYSKVSNEKYDKQKTPPIPFKLEQNLFFNNDDEDEVLKGMNNINKDKYIYDRLYTNKKEIDKDTNLTVFFSKPERDFIQFIADNDHIIKSWWKNGDYGKGNLCIPYRDNQDKLHGFYPDFIIEFTNGTIGIFETKEVNDANIPTPIKCEELRKYLDLLRHENRGKKFIGGICIRVENKELNKNYWYYNIEGIKEVNYKSDNWNKLDFENLI